MRCCASWWGRWRASVARISSEVSSYRRAWLLIDTMNRCFREPVIETASGGKGGGGARITAIGEEVLKRYRVMEDTAVESVRDQITEFSGLLANEPPEAPSPDEPE